MGLPLVAVVTVVVLAVVAPACGRLGYEGNGDVDSGAAGDTGAVVDSAPTDTGPSPPDSSPSDTGIADSSPVDAGRPEPVVVDTGSFPFALVADATNLYWADFDGGALHRLPIAGGPSTELVPSRPSPGVYGLAVADGAVYMCDSSTGEIRHVSTAGGPVTVIAVSPCDDLAVDGTHLYWSSTDPLEPTIRRLALPDGVPEDVVGLGSARNLAIRGDRLFWTDYTNGEISTHPTVGGSVNLLATVARGGPWDLTFDDTFVYWADHHADVGAIMRVPLGGGTAEVVAGGQDGPHGIALDGGVLYWTNDFGGTVIKMPLGGAAVVVASGQEEPKNLVVTIDAVYWTTRGGAVMRIAK
ncbi:MAG: hypothetical protein DRJ42_16180 [Deltaproteobacteria bacterium]|nr:MAG: hypothetical protein DRJ42_16180 [Deltaproteobacteria bacterium]